MEEKRGGGMVLLYVWMAWKVDGSHSLAPPRYTTHLGCRRGYIHLVTIQLQCGLVTCTRTHPHPPPSAPQEAKQSIKGLFWRLPRCGLQEQRYPTGQRGVTQVRNFLVPSWAWRASCRAGVGRF